MSVLFTALADELEKIASMGGHVGELAGLGILAAPHAYSAVTGKKPSQKTERTTELAGLGVLAAPSALAVGKHLLKRGSVTKLSSDLWEPSSGRVIGSEGGTRAANRGLSTSVAKAAPVARKTFGMADLKAAYGKAGVKPGLGSVLRKLGAQVTPQMMASFDAHRAHMATQKPQAAAPAAKLTHPTDTRRASMLADFTPAGKFSRPAAAAASAGPRMAPLGRVVSGQSSAGGALRRAATGLLRRAA